MFGLVNVALVGALGACGYALWVRRDTWSSRWDANPSRVLVLMGCAGLLMSPVGSTFFDPLAHRVFGLWNVAGLLAVLCMFCAMLVMFEHLVTRLTDSDQARLLGRRHVTTPLKFGLPLVVVVFCVADRGHPEYLDVFAPRGGPWFAAYWALVAGLALYLFVFTGRVLLTLRRDPRSKSSAELYLVWVTFKVAAILAQLTSVLAGSTVTLPTWICVGVSSTAFAYASALSWQTRAQWFKPFRRISPEAAGD
ncbi:hypothetical protein [Mycolicibacter longobardus]|uniref:Uncharacterized protein n=1 Tax=Mycolicibacter longobardus TaxID=1108812 RepID=A0A1X1YPS4_9MYCO|nr:hypothetical protein [Mycolicibacter longobardus]MCV7382593.1 hypothetical protein [Mycolicibacter longobardus]ORW13119.1 hypothetical protein AWC16_05265 [Mycolicibacter longobardus]